MPAWFVGAASNELVYEAEDVMKKYPAECDDEGKDKWIAFLKANGRWKDGVVSAQPSDYIMLDGGGCVGTKEPKVGWEANGCPIKTYVRHLPFTLEMFKRLEPKDPKLPGIVGFGGFCRVYLFSTKTIEESIPQMERLLKGTESLRQELEMDMQNMFNRSPHTASARKCGCMSGLQYAECCGKFIETPEHKEKRELMKHGQETEVKSE